MLDWINFLMLSDEERGTKAEQRLGDLREQASAIRRRTGHDPLTFVEFTGKLGMELDKRSTNNLFKGAAIGGAAVGGIGLLTRVRSPLNWAAFGALLGGGLGAFFGTQNDSRSSAIDHYGQYLQVFAEKASALPGPHVTAVEEASRMAFRNHDKTIH